MTIIVNNDYVTECENGLFVVVNNHNLHRETVGMYVWNELVDKETGKSVEFVKRGQKVDRIKRQLCNDFDSVEFIQSVRQKCLDSLGI